MLQKAVITSSLIAFSMLGATTVLAGETGCTPQYGGKDCPEVVITLDKKVADPRSMTTTTDSKGGTTAGIMGLKIFQKMILAYLGRLFNI